MFSHLSVSHGVHRGDVPGRVCVCGRGSCVAGGHAWWGGHEWQGVCMVGGGMRDRGACVAGETATTADGTHPTGMLSCVENLHAYSLGFFILWTVPPLLDISSFK